MVLDLQYDTIAKERGPIDEDEGQRLTFPRRADRFQDHWAPLLLPRCRSQKSTKRLYGEGDTAEAVVLPVQTPAWGWGLEKVPFLGFSGRGRLES